MLVIWRSLIIIYGTATISDRNYERSNLRKITTSSTKGILYYKKKTVTSLMLYDSSFNGCLSHEVQVQLTTIFLVVIQIYFCTSVLHMFATRMYQHENDIYTVRLVPRVVSF